jgi:hypothetical protein
MVNIERIANSAARGEGYGLATTIYFSPRVQSPCVINHIRRGYRKYTTGEYVPRKYLANFGWKNTYYQNAETTVAMPLWMGWLVGEDL